ncbi:Acyltransferase family protein [Hartmannibacter diazotrophicus]|uniref:Acyltransferase family protein n=1 Tax=Hartmannibacter diazotrophicus TaxID=1482074 RepID=A0A2C9DCE4_9HYPH|nr:acyltransferase [Hartmannibacter diazotrophicus]SON58002.1 Acyltransferase family protein [Hartmannibacter diazotrophicus]
MTSKTIPAFRPLSEAYLDLIRGIAANLVLVEHTSRIFWGEPILPFGTIGVTFFFLISGFLIMNSAWRRFGAPGPQLESFLIDRTSRIFTAFVPVLVIVALVVPFLVSGNWSQPGISKGPVAFIANLFLLNDYPLFQITSRLLHTFQFHVRSYETAEPFWTIPIEYWIYVVFGIFMFCFVNGYRMRGLLLPVLFVVALPVVIWNSFAGGGDSLTLIWCVGALFGYVFIRQFTMSRQRIAMVAAAITGFGLIGFMGRVAQNGFVGYEVQTTIFAAMILFGLLFMINQLDVRFRLLEKLAQGFASYSYSLYLIHNTVLIIVYENIHPANASLTPIIGMVAAHLVAMGCYWCFERHHKTVARYWKARLSRRTADEPAPAFASS